MKETPFKKEVKILLKVLTTLIVLISINSCSKHDEQASLPILTSFSPTIGPKTTVVNINGSNFGNTTNTQVFFNDVEAVVQTVTETQIIAIVPARAFTGLVKVISNGTELIGQEFTYLISDVQVSTLAGSIEGFADGTGANAQFNQPSRIAVDTQGSLYVADASNHKIRKISPDGVVSTLAGSTEGFADGTGANAKFSNPRGISVDTQGNIYVADVSTDSHKIRKITPNGVVSTLAGSTEGFTDGTGANAQLSFPRDVAVDDQNNLYVADRGNYKIRKISPDGVVSTLAGSDDGSVDGTGANAKFQGPFGITVDSQGNVYVADSGSFRLIRKITPSGVVTTLAGSTTGFADGTGVNAQFNRPRGITVDSQGNLYLADRLNHRIRKISPSGVVTTLAGSISGFADGLGANAQFSLPTGIAVDSQNNIYVADLLNHKIRKITQE